MKSDRLLRLSVILAVLILVGFEIAGRVVKTEDPLFPIVQTAVTRAVGAFVFVLLIRRMGYPVLGFGKIAREGKTPLPATEKTVLALSVLVALNNFPWIGILSGKAEIPAPPAVIAFFAVECAAVGCFEELAFRGFLLPYCFGRVKEKRRPAFLAAFLSSALFALVHLVNLFAGASPAAVFMQIGYSFLIGGMCACVLFASGSVWICAALHAVYNFCGTILSRFGVGTRWDAVTVAVTAALGGVAAAVGIRYLLTTKETL